MADQSEPSTHEPMMKLGAPEDKNGGVPVLSYNVPEPTSYTGNHFIELNLMEEGETAKDYFTLECFGTPSSSKGVSSTLTNLIQKIKSFFSTDSALNSYLIKNHNTDLNSSNVTFNKPLVAQQISGGNRLILYRDLYGHQAYVVAPPPPPIRPRLVLIETYRLSTYSGSYGAGKTLKTFSLLPGEKTKISIKTYHKTEQSSKEASSILDSFTQESADDFERSVVSEQSAKQNEAETFEYHAEAEASCSFGFAEAKVSGGVKGGTNSAREEFAKNIQNATSKHANKASAKRDVQINTSTEVKEESGEETEIVREIENINVSRTLNFVFRQMNQEFITVLHLTDVRLGFFNGDSKAKKEFTLPELDNLLEEYILAGKRDQVKAAILNQILEIRDYKDDPPPGLDELGEPPKDQDGHPIDNHFIRQKDYKKTVNGAETNWEYYQFAKDLNSKYKDVTKREILVPGIITSVKKYVLRTDGVIVDSILGQGDALDAYSHGLQDEDVKTKQLSNLKQQCDIEKEKLALDIINTNGARKADLYQKLFVQPICPSSQSDKTTTPQ